MSEELVVLNNQNALAQGGLGMNSTLFDAKPSTLEIVQRTSQQAGAEPGRFRDTATGMHFDTMEWVLLAEPVKQRAYYIKGEMSRDSKRCFSLDNIEPHKLAKEPQAPYCANCPIGSWEKYRQTGDSKDVPLCKEYWHLTVADRATQLPYYFNVKGLSITPFELGMKNLGRFAEVLRSNVREENRKRGYMLVRDPKTGNVLGFAPDPKFVLPEGQTERLPIVPLPNLSDIKFPVSIVSEQRKAGLSYVLQIGKPVLLKEEARAEFGNIYLDIVRAREARKAQYELAAAASAESDDAGVIEAPARSEVAAVVGPVSGTVVPKSDITI